MNVIRLSVRYRAPRTRAGRPAPRRAARRRVRRRHGAARLGAVGIALLGREAVEQARAAGLHQRLLAAAGAAVRGVPRLHVARVLQALQVVVADDRRAFGALGPVAAGGVAAGGGVHALRVGAGEDVVRVRLVAAAVHLLALLGERVVLVDLVVAGMQVGHALRHHHALGVLPRTLADA